MVLLRQTHLGLAALILTALLGLSSTGEGVKQELWLYPEGGGALYFDSHVPDLSSYSSILPKIVRSCAIGVFAIYSTVNYTEYLTYIGHTAGTYYCENDNVATAKSLRHWAANDTSTDAISLYPGIVGGGNAAEGKETYVTERARTDINLTIISAVATGSSDWMLFEGQHLDGKSKCMLVPDNHHSGWLFGTAIVQSLNMTTIGSVFKGCDEREIQLYRESNLM